MGFLIKTAFWLYFTILALTGSLALAGLEELNYKLLLGLPLLLGLLLSLTKKTFDVDKKLLSLILVLFLLVALSLGVSQNHQNGKLELAHYLAGLSLFVFGACYRQELEKPLFLLILGLGVFFSLYSLILPHLPFALVWLKPVSGYNLVFPTYRLHNHLGDFLVLPLLLLIAGFGPLRRKKWLSIAWIVTFGLLIFYSYSRSSYTALAAGLLWLFLGKRKIRLGKRQVFLIVGLFLAALVFLALTTTEAGFNPQWANAVWQKPLFNGRNHYWSVAIKTIRDYPLFGLGPGNFAHAMGRYNIVPFDWTRNSLNMFLEIACSSGLMAMVVFGLLLARMWPIIDRQSPFFWLFVALLVNFQTDYTYQISLMWLLFWLFLGLCLKPENNKKNCVLLKPSWLMLPGLLSILLLLQQGLLSLMMANSNYSGALLVDPFNRPAREKVIVRQLMAGSYNQALVNLQIYQRLFKADAAAQYAVGNFYYALGKKNQAMVCYQQSYAWNAYENLDIYKKIHALHLKLGQKKAGKQFLQGYGQKVSRLKGQSYFTEFIKKDWQNFKKHHPEIE